MSGTLTVSVHFIAYLELKASLHRDHNLSVRYLHRYGAVHCLIDRPLLHTRVTKVVGMQCLILPKIFNFRIGEFALV